MARVMAWLIETPASQDGLQVAKKAGASPRTLARLFRQEIGMTFTQWKTRLLLIEAIERLTRDTSVTEVAITSATLRPVTLCTCFEATWASRWDAMVCGTATPEGDLAVLMMPGRRFWLSTAR